MSNIKFSSNKDVLNYLKPALNNEVMNNLLEEATTIHENMCKEKGIKMGKGSISHIEEVTDAGVVCVGEDFYGDSYTAFIPIELFKK